MFAVDSFIDTVQGAKKQFVKTFVQNEEVAKSLQTYIDAQQSTFVDSDFEDEGHFRPSGSEKLANNIAPAISQNCL